MAVKRDAKVKKNTSPLPEDAVETYTLKLELAAPENMQDLAPLPSIGVLKK